MHTRFISSEPTHAAIVQRGYAQGAGDCSEHGSLAGAGGRGCPGHQLSSVARYHKRRVDKGVRIMLNSRGEEGMSPVGAQLTTCAVLLHVGVLL